MSKKNKNRSSDNQSDQAKKVEPQSTGNINIRSELKRGYAVFKAFENALAIAERLDSVNIDIREAERRLLDINEEKKKAEENATIVMDGFNDHIEESKRRLEDELISFANDISSQKEKIISEYNKVQDEMQKNRDRLLALGKQEEEKLAKISILQKKIDELNVILQETTQKFIGISGE